MTQRPTTLGDCPWCEEAIPRDALLGRYERNGWPVTLAECPACGDLVHPR